MDNLDPLPLNQRWEMARFVVRVASSLIWGEGVLFHFILFQIVAPFNLIINI